MPAQNCWAVVRMFLLGKKRGELPTQFGLWREDSSEIQRAQEPGKGRVPCIFQLISPFNVEERLINSHLFDAS